jgi:CDP-glucose 4,6-dehydratase
MLNDISKSFFGKKVLITGHTGFKGSWLSLWLKSLGAKVHGISIDIPSSPSHFEVANLSDKIDDYRIDICDANAVKLIVKKIQPDFVFHLAAQALVRPSYENPLETMITNAIGSANILDALRSLENQVVAVMITSDKAYDNLEWVWGYREIDRLGGKDPYSASKGMAELAIRSFVESFFSSKDSNVRVAVTRAGNVIGGGDWAVDRIVPDCMISWSNNKVVDIRNPDATRPWQHVLEPLRGYLILAAELSTNSLLNGEAYNFGPNAHQNHSVRELINAMSTHWDSVRWNDTSNSKEYLHEAGLLKLNCDKALYDLEWQPILEFEETVLMTVEWYRHFYQNSSESMYNFTISQIEKYTNLAKLHDLKSRKI